MCLMLHFGGRLNPLSHCRGELLTFPDTLSRLNPKDVESTLSRHCKELGTHSFSSAATEV